MNDLGRRKKANFPPALEHPTPYVRSIYKDFLTQKSRTCLGAAAQTFHLFSCQERKKRELAENGSQGREGKKKRRKARHALLALSGVDRTYGGGREAT